MAINTDNLETLVERVRNQFRAYLPDSDSWIYPNNMWIASTVIGGLFWELFGTLRNIPDLVMPDTASGVYLQRLGNICGISQTLATVSCGSITVSGTDGVSIPSGSVFATSSGLLFTSTASAIITDGAATVSVCSQETGITQNLSAGTPLDINTAIAGIDSVVVASDAITGGLCDETEDEFRERVLLCQKKKSSCGSLCSFKDWALSIEGVEAACVVRQPSGLVQVMVQLNGASLADVNDYLNDDCRKPICVTVEAVEMIAETMCVTLDCAAGVDPAIKEQALALLTEYLQDSNCAGKGYTNDELTKVLCGLGVDVAVTGGDFIPTTCLHIFNEANVC